MSVVTDLTTVLVLVLIAAFVWALASLRALPTGRRPDIPVYTRSGKLRGVGPLDPPDDEPPPPQDTAHEHDLSGPGPVRR